MVELQKKELMEINGGGFGFWVFVGGAITFLIGVVDGYVRPLSCHA